jgi:hypothetical protein
MLAHGLKKPLNLHPAYAGSRRPERETIRDTMSNHSKG